MSALFYKVPFANNIAICSSVNLHSCRYFIYCTRDVNRFSVHYFFIINVQNLLIPILHFKTFWFFAFFNEINSSPLSARTSKMIHLFVQVTFFPIRCTFFGLMWSKISRANILFVVVVDFCFLPEHHYSFVLWNIMLTFVSTCFITFYHFQSFLKV